MSTQTYTVTGMTCGHCVASVTEEVSEIAGVESVEGLFLTIVVTGETAEIASATKCEPTQISSSGSKALKKRSGNAFTSHHHSPIE